LDGGGVLMKKDQKITVKRFVSQDWPMVESWWIKAGEIAPLESMMPTDSTFIALIDSVPALSVSLYLTNTPEVAYVENFIGNPDLRGPIRKEATQILLDHISSFAHAAGYKRLMCMTEKSALKSHYQSIGFTQTLNGVATFIKETKCHH
jgi:hypothetical protein